MRRPSEESSRLAVSNAVGILPKLANQATMKLEGNCSTGLIEKPGQRLDGVIHHDSISVTEIWIFLLGFRVTPAMLSPAVCWVASNSEGLSNEEIALAYIEVAGLEARANVPFAAWHSKNLSQAEKCVRMHRLAENSVIVVGNAGSFSLSSNPREVVPREIKITREEQIQLRV